MKKNKYVNHFRISEARFRQIINQYLLAIRLRILKLSELQSVPLVEQIEVGESYFGTWQVRGKRGDKVY
jgi:hypothetical protein